MPRKFMYPLKCRFCGVRIRKAREYSPNRTVYEDNIEIGYYVCKGKEIIYHEPETKEENIQKLLSKVVQDL